MRLISFTFGAVFAVLAYRKLRQIARENREQDLRNKGKHLLCINICSN